MKHHAPWLLVAFVLALLLTPGLCADRPTRVFLDSPIGRASYLDVSRPLVPAVAVMVPGPDESIPLRSNFSFDHALLRAYDTGPPWIDLCGPSVLLRVAPRLKLQRPAGSAGGPQGGKLPSEAAKNEAPAKVGVLQRVIFATGFS
jgi:hypothetical protein